MNQHMILTTESRTQGHARRRTTNAREPSRFFRPLGQHENADPWSGPGRHPYWHVLLRVVTDPVDGSAKPRSPGGAWRRRLRCRVSILVPRQIAPHRARRSNSHVPQLRPCPLRHGCGRRRNSTLAGRCMAELDPHGLEPAPDRWDRAASRHRGRRGDLRGSRASRPSASAAFRAMGPADRTVSSAARIGSHGLADRRRHLLDRHRRGCIPSCDPGNRQWLPRGRPADLAGHRPSGGPAQIWKCFVTDRLGGSGAIGARLRDLGPYGGRYLGLLGRRR